jgi:hypothetical protein
MNARARRGEGGGGSAGFGGGGLGWFWGRGGWHVDTVMACVMRSRRVAGEKRPAHRSVRTVPLCMSSGDPVGGVG